LPYLREIACHVAERRIGVHDQPVSVFLSKRPNGVYHGLDHTRDLELLEEQLHLPGFDFA
jgi:hypothetical protein